MKEYVTIPSTECEAEVVIEKSRFIASAIGIESAEHAMRYIAEKRKKYFDATHNCYAYVAGDKAKFSDDGEPQGTAGLPILECIKNNGLDFVCVVVTRYFGGIKLGAGGLVRAYGGSCAEILHKCDRLRMTNCTDMNVEIEYALLSSLRRAVAPYAQEIKVEYADNVHLLLRFPTRLQNTITDILMENTLGKAKIAVASQLLCPLEQTKIC
ncbi:MAG: YigZ family protein [Corallococcus sp.]|nr:YigZ family protein [Corallococcus sp.]MCM1359138.1 YigZ family protein [Corallococcus sp.]MCM1394528.1 YigZ family protein [Corallococcus sp.]